MATKSGLERQPITNGVVDRVTFQFYSEEELLRLSVKEIINPILFDELNNPQRGGLYDLALGPYEPKQQCATCGLGFLQCPGHFGHIKLAVPTYHPLVFSVLLRLLRSVCFHCYRFKMAHEAVERYTQRLQLVVEGRIVEAFDQPASSGRASKLLKDLQLNPTTTNTDPLPPSPPTATHPTPPRGGVNGHAGHVALIEEALTMLRTEFFREQPAGKCANCGCHNPAVKQFGNTKLFMMSLKPAARAANASRGVEIKPVGGGGTAALTVEDVETHAAHVTHQQQQRRQQQRHAAEHAGDPTIAYEGAEEDAGEEEEDVFMHEKEDDEQEDDENPMTEAKQHHVDQNQAKSTVNKRSKVKDVDALTAAGIARQRVDGRGRPVGSAVNAGENTQGSGQLSYLPPSEVYAMVQRLWETNHDVLKYLFCAGPNNTNPGAPLEAPPHAWKMLFLRIIPVTPNMFRRPSRVGDGLYEHAQNTILTRVLNINIDITSTMQQPLPERVRGVLTNTLTEAQQAEEKLNRCLQQWLQLQEAVNNLMDSSKVKSTRNPVQGIKQVLEKKEGIFRMHMMGKRVNYAARSVISPDPYIGTDQIGVPSGFAMTLSFPERVTAWNVEQLRTAVINGAHTWPGAVAVETADGKLIHLERLEKKRREGLARQLLTGIKVAPAGGPSSTGGPQRKSRVPTLKGSTIVYRHMRDGDLMLTNRQPTLHKPGLMAHSARIFHTNEKTIRLHYANCSTFNADFDGDEINLHLPQDQLGRAEGYGIVHANHQYIVPTAGAPIRGLIQDHVLAGVMMTYRDCFLTRAQVSRLVYAAITRYSPLGEAVLVEEDVVLEVPAVLKPRALWTGKQVITTVLKHLTRGLPPLTMHAKCKTPPDYVGNGSSEAELCVFRSTLVHGVLDKAAYGKFGLVHAFHELYGGKSADQLLNALSKMLTHYLQLTGFTCGMDDLLLTSSAESSRAQLLGKVARAAAAAAAKYVGLTGQQKVLENHDASAKKTTQAVQAVREEVGARWGALQDGGAGYDMTCGGALHPIASEVVKACLPKGLVKPFPVNCMALMTSTGAKGSIVNFSQISCLLGQQELEGRRVPRLPNGKTLPCFAAYDPQGRADGFISDRFLSGLRPQEYYFHCMAGREGLVDTTVKTARSGYLQRCIIKNLEALRCHYDGTVRNDTDGSVVQFAYGEDGVDVMETAYLNRFDFAAANAPALAHKLGLDTHLDKSHTPAETTKQGKKDDVMDDCKRMLRDPGALPVMALHPATSLGVTSDTFAAALDTYIHTNPDALLGKRDAGDKKKSKKKQKRHTHLSTNTISPEAFKTLMHLRYLRSLAAPGEAVGVLAGQSIGEPSTQMTLNTFHMAGRGEANVTLGIPRLRELFMTASTEIKTPVMTLPLHPETTKTAAQGLTNTLRRIRFAEALTGLSVSEGLAAFEAGVGRRYDIVLRFHEEGDLLTHGVDLPFSVIKVAAEKVLLPKVQDAVAWQLRSAERMSVQFVASEAPVREGGGVGEVGGGQQGEGPGEGTAPPPDDDASSSDDDDVDPDDAKDAQRNTTARSSYLGDQDDAQLQRQVRQAHAEEVLADMEEDEEGGQGEEGGGADGGQVGERNAQGMHGHDGSVKTVVGDASTSTPPTSSSAASTAKKQQLKKIRDMSKGMLAELRVDEEMHEVCISITVPLDAPRLLMLELAEKVAYQVPIRAVQGIEKCFLVEAAGSDRLVVQTDGINLQGAWMHDDVISVNEVTCNSVATMLATYGVEAARATLVAEVSSVFGAYGIGVDKRHLGLIADHMTQQGGYRPCNRIGMQLTTSPLLKMSFETASQFLTDASVRGACDGMASPASRIAVGRPVECGTGCMDLVMRAQ